MKFKFIPVIATAVLTTVLTLFVATHYQKQIPFFAVGRSQSDLSAHFASYTDGNNKNTGPVDFEMAAESSVKAVVHIKVTTKARTVTADDDPFGSDFFGGLFGQRQYYIPPQMGSGSGVVISPDGYIVTNNHVVADASQVTVTFNDRYTTQAKVIATDPATDIAVVKVDEKNLPYMQFGNSDDVKLGQWVLAVGYPLMLDATVTAGIVSAKSRSIGINSTQSASAVESFIQTDAAVNPGNSGGALVNTTGQLIGINSAIASPTGSYAGYSYAIPSNIVRKAVNDLLKYGKVERGYLGIMPADGSNITPEEMNAYGLDKNDGVYVAKVLSNSGAEKAGIRKGDFIISINNIAVHTATELIEQVTNYHPGDNISVAYTRDGKQYTASVELENINNTTAILKGDNSTKIFGASFRVLSSSEKSKYGIDRGVMVTDIGDGILSKQTEMHKGFIITDINDAGINTVNDLQQALAGSSTAQIGGFYPGSNSMYYYGLNINGDSSNEQ